MQKAILTDELKFVKLNIEDSPVDVFSKISKKYKTAYLLESTEGPKKLSQYSFIGFDPEISISVKNGNLKVFNTNTNKKENIKVKDPLAYIKKIIHERATPNNRFRFIGGAVGYISYDAIRYLEKLPQNAKDDINFPDVDMGIFEDGIVFDYKQKSIYYYYRKKNRLKEIANLLQNPARCTPPSFTRQKLNITQENFEKAVKKAKNYVNSGDVFQVVLSKRFAFKFNGDLIDFYKSLRSINPSPYMYYFKSDRRQIIGSSPEMLIRIENRTVETFPIAGTRPSSINKTLNKNFAVELLKDPKERAEHIMLVDLARNDIGKISKYGTVRVPEMMKVHRYSHVQHIVSRVIGDLKDSYESYDAFKAVFPAGTVSGAPKIRAMEIIDELEPNRRGPYAGAVGYFSFNGNADFAITIRTLFTNENNAYVQSGAGIVADSVPEKEWIETEHKASALIKAMNLEG